MKILIAPFVPRLSVFFLQNRFSPTLIYLSVIHYLHVDMISFDRISYCQLFTAILDLTIFKSFSFIDKLHFAFKVKYVWLLFYFFIILIFNKIEKESFNNPEIKNKLLVYYVKQRHFLSATADVILRQSYF